jgi:GDP/UDP-N,N'-diacetylbacillosamine 2-epimerase (hydrolysing)
LVNFHPETLNKNLAKKQINEILSALGQLKNTNLIFTMPGADLESQIITNLVKRFIRKNKNSYFFKSLGQVNYFSFLKQVDGLIGNSSSGILEIPYFKKGTINIGTRQSGRLISKSVINTEIKKNKIISSVKKLLSKKFQKDIKKNINPYGSPGASKKIIKILKKIKIKNIFNKSFFDIKNF